MGENYGSFEELEYPNTPEPDAQKHVRQGGGTYKEVQQSNRGVVRSINVQ